VGRALAERCIAALREAGIDKCHLFVYVDNPAARAFWARSGWMEREELVIMSRYTQAAQEA
jgi:ribosomal protein S18 acetylase RimI-like enzyme